MTDRVHGWLDGDVPLESLTAEERRRALRLRAALDLAADDARVRSPGLSGAIMDRVARAPAPRPGLLARLRAALVPLPGALALRPAAALAAACLAAGFGLGLWTASRGGDAAPGLAAAEETPAVFVRFDVVVDQARTVHLAGSFSEWQPAYELTPAGGGHWTVTVPLEPGVHDYVFLVDGERQVLDPAAPRIPDGFGSYNNRLALLASST